MNKELDKVNAPTKKKSPSFADPALPLAVVVTKTRWDEPPWMRNSGDRSQGGWSVVCSREW